MSKKIVVETTMKIVNGGKVRSTFSRGVDSNKGDGQAIYKFPDSYSEGWNATASGVTTSGLPSREAAEAFLKLHQSLSSQPKI